MGTIRGWKTNSLLLSPSLSLFPSFPLSPRPPLSLSLLKIHCSCCPGVSGALNIDSTELHGERVKRGFITWFDCSAQTQARPLKTQHVKMSTCKCHLQVCALFPPPKFTQCPRLLLVQVPHHLLCKGLIYPTACGLYGLFCIYFNYICFPGQCIYFKSHYLQLPKHVSTERTVSI